MILQLRGSTTVDDTGFQGIFTKDPEDPAWLPFGKLGTPLLAAGAFFLGRKLLKGGRKRRRNPSRRRRHVRRRRSHRRSRRR